MCLFPGLILDFEHGWSRIFEPHSMFCIIIEIQLPYYILYFYFEVQ